MADTPIRNRSIRQCSFAIMFLTVCVGLLVTGIGLYNLPAGLRHPEQLLGVLTGIGAGILMAAVGLLVHLVVILLIKAEGNINRIHHDTLDVLDVIKRQERTIRVIADNSQISDAAKSIAHREREREALRQAIRDEMYSGNWDAASYLVDQMEQRFGYMQEAKALRAEIAQVREMTIEEKLNDVIGHIESLMNEAQWHRARQEIDRLMKLFPRHERITALPSELNRRRNARKQALLQQWQQAVQRNEIDTGIQILTELDAYLTPEEAQSLRDDARDVFKAHLLNLGVQFSLAVQEQRWRDALEIGLQIRQEFPNSRMAQEVAEKLDVLRVRAGFVSDAEVIQRRATT